MNRSLLCALAVCAGSSVSMGQLVGPSTTTSPYVLPSLGSGVITKSILTVGDNIGGYRMVGIPDGLGAIKNTDGTFDLLMTHELGATAGVTRAHGSTGSFVSRWNISSNLTVNSGRDHLQNNTSVWNWNTGTSAYDAPGTFAFDRLCSADLAAPTAYFNPNTGLGTQDRIFLAGEETRPPFATRHGSAWAHIVSGTSTNQSWELPRLGRMAWENGLASPFAQDKTIVIGMDDSAASTNAGPADEPSELYVYVGTKTNSGSTVDRAGLTNGSLFGVKVNGVNAENNASNQALGGSNSGNFSMHNFGNVANQTGATLQDDSIDNDVTRFQRLEDGQWDSRPGHENDYYFLTTASITTNSRLWRMRFNDITQPELGGQLEVILDGDEGHRMLDNMTIDSHGRILMQEDVGNNSRLGKIWLYDIDSGGMVEVAAHDSSRFINGNAGYLGTQDEESSGIIDAKDILGDGWFLFDVQAHYSITGELVEGGQLAALYVSPGIIPAPGAAALLGLGGLLAARRRR